MSLESINSDDFKVKLKLMIVGITIIAIALFFDESAWINETIMAFGVPVGARKFIVGSILIIIAALLMYITWED